MTTIGTQSEHEVFLALSFFASEINSSEVNVKKEQFSVSSVSMLGLVSSKGCGKSLSTIFPMLIGSLRYGKMVALRSFLLENFYGIPHRSRASCQKIRQKIRKVDADRSWTKVKKHKFLQSYPLPVRAESIIVDTIIDFAFDEVKSKSNTEKKHTESLVS